MKPLPNVVRVEAHGEPPIPCPSLQAALEHLPMSCEAHIATSLGGVRLAEATAEGREWILTSAGLDVQDRTGWKVAS